MKTYKVGLGGHYFSGLRIEPLFFQVLFTIAIIIWSFYSSPWWLLLIPAVVTAIIAGLHERTSKFYFKAKFDDTCLYSLDRNFDQINKLYGFSLGYHHHNSARIGWRCVDGKTIELMAYCYVNSKRVSKTIMNVNPREWAVCSIQNKSDKYVFRVMSNNSSGKICIINKERSPLKYGILKLFIYKLYPYFGGSIPAPHKMRIDIADIKRFSYDE